MATSYGETLINMILQQEIPKIDKIMQEVVKEVSKKFGEEAVRCLDRYYDTYTPMRYVRLYGPMRNLRNTKDGKTKQKGHGGGVSLHAAVARQIGDVPAIGYFGGAYGIGGWFGGIHFDESYFKAENSMRHVGRGISEFEIVENFLFAGEGGHGDWRSDPRSGWSGENADSELVRYRDTFGPQLITIYNNIYNKNK